MGLLKKLKGSSVIEVIVSMLILIIIFSIAFTFLLRLQSTVSNKTLEKLRMEIPKMVHQIKQNMSPSYEDHNFRIDYKTLPYKNIPGLKRIEILVIRTDGKIVLTHNELWLSENN